MAGTIFLARPICKDTWLIQGDGCNSYLVVGDESGVLIDTGYALENIQEFAQSLTEKPVRWAANTHGHFDHTGGNGWFERAFMSAKALEVAKVPYPSKAALHYPLEYLATIVGDGDVINLGGRTLEVFEIPAHAPSSLAFLDASERILFTGDEADAAVMLYWMQEEPQPTIEQHARNMEKLLRHRRDFNFICGGHQWVYVDASKVEDYLEHDRLILAGHEGEQMVLREGKGPDPADFRMYQLQYKRSSTFRDTRIGYDIRYVHDRKSSVYLRNEYPS
jgi:glyoxylase-like metal-dependent hydrolase (beta-lactamase superfamily II)